MKNTTQTITAKVQILIKDDHKQTLIDTMNAYRQACNFVSSYIIKTHDLKQLSLHQALYYDLRSQFGLKSQMAQSVLKTVIARYRTILENQKKWIQPSFKKLQYDLVWNRDYSLTKDMFSVNTLQGRIKVDYFKQGMEQYFDKERYSFGTAKLIYKKNKFYLHIPVTYEIENVAVSDIQHVVGIDRGINFVVTTYNSHGKTEFVSGRAIKQKRAHYKALRQQLQKKQTPSARRRLKRIGQRENRWMQDVNHQVSKALVNNNPKGTLFVLEDLGNVRQATERVRHKDRYVSVSWSFYDLEQKLMYKAERVGDMVVKVDPAYTSQTCPKCGHIHKQNRNKKQHKFICRQCGYSSNDDRIAAMNLYRKGINYLIDSQVPDTVVVE